MQTGISCAGTVQPTWVTRRKSRRLEQARSLTLTLSVWIWSVSIPLPLEKKWAHLVEPLWRYSNFSNSKDFTSTLENYAVDNEMDLCNGQDERKKVERVTSILMMVKVVGPYILNWTERKENTCRCVIIVYTQKRRNHTNIDSDKLATWWDIWYSLSAFRRVSCTFLFYSLVKQK